MTTILAATDLSHRADRAVARAFRMAAGLDAKLCVATVLDGDLPERLTAQLLDEAKALLVDFCKAQPGADQVDWHARADLGDIATDLHAVADEIGADLIVFGLHRQRMFLDGFRETTLEHLVRVARRPVLLVREPADHDYARAVAAVDASPASTAALRAARRFLPDAKIHSFHACWTGLGGGFERDPQHVMGKAQLRETRSKIDEWSREHLPEGVERPEVIDGALGAVFAAEIDRRHAQVAILGAHARHGLAHWVLGGFASELVRDPPCDLLIGRPV